MLSLDFNSLQAFLYCAFIDEVLMNNGVFCLSEITIYKAPLSNDWNDIK